MWRQVEPAEQRLLMHPALFFTHCRHEKHPDKYSNLQKLMNQASATHTQTSGNRENRRQMLLNSFGESIRELNEQTVPKLTAGEIVFSLGQAPFQDGGIVFHH